MKKAVLVCFLFQSIISQAQTFNPDEAVKWLNNLTATKTSITSGDIHYFPTSFFLFDCVCVNGQQFFKLGYPDIVETHNWSAWVELQTLSPATLTIKEVPTDPDRFYVEGHTTNSENIIKRDWYYKDGHITPTGLLNSTSFGPYDKGSDMENRVKNVLSKLILHCGGKKDTF